MSSSVPLGKPSILRTLSISSFVSFLRSIFLILTFPAFYDDTQLACVLALCVRRQDIIDLCLKGFLVKRRQLFQLLQEVITIHYHRLKSLEQSIDCLYEEIIHTLWKLSAAYKIVDSLLLISAEIFLLACHNRIGNRIEQRLCPLCNKVVNPDLNVIELAVYVLHIIRQTETAVRADVR